MSSHLRYCTLTGLDRHTDLNHVAELGARYPFAEWGVLFSASRAGQDTRYEPMAWVRRTGEFLSRGMGLNCALHLCGDAVHDFIAGEPLLRALAQVFGRVQLNLPTRKPSADELLALAAALSSQPGHPSPRLILQMHPGNAELCRTLVGHVPFEFLFDASGGRGELRSSWPSLESGAKHGLSAAPCGFAGGLGPENIAAELPRILQASAGRPFWVDMEGRLRDKNDRFDSNRAEKVLRQVDAVLRSPAN